MHTHTLQRARVTAHAFMNIIFMVQNVVVVVVRYVAARTVRAKRFLFFSYLQKMKIRIWYELKCLGHTAFPH